MLLSIDTCGVTGSLALARWDGTVSLLAQAELASKTYAAQLVPKLREMLAAQSLSLRDLTAIVIVNGPGSFTGIRIGVSSAKGFAEALGIPLVAVSRLAILARKAGTTAAALNAGRGEFYFRDQAGEMLLTAEEIHQRLRGSLAICEESTAQIFPNALLVDPPSAADALEYAAPRLVAKDFDDVVTLDGHYVRRSDAEIFAKPALQAIPAAIPRA
jgi:tRNA threonylcarbamoyladenosine biosynthesis protein TsaB